MSQNKSINELLLYGRNYLKQKNIDTASLDALVILMYTLALSKVELFSKVNQIVTVDEESEYYHFIEQRGNGKPTAYITKTQEFMSLDFDVNFSTLIPRQDTEILVETILNTLKFRNISYILDIGTGTGCIPISLVHYCKNIKAIATDINSKALEIAKINAYKNNVYNEIAFIHSDLFSNIPDEVIGKLDVIVSNPPYIPSSEIDTLMKEVCKYEPIISLDGGSDGLKFYRLITKYAYKYICSKGFLFYEIGYNQGEAVYNIMQQNGFENIKIVKDLSGLDRVIVGNKKF